MERRSALNESVAAHFRRVLRAAEPRMKEIALSKQANAPSSDLAAAPSGLAHKMDQVAELLESEADGVPASWCREAARALRTPAAETAPDAGLVEAKLEQVSTLLHEFNPYNSDWAFRRGVIFDLLLEARAALSRAGERS